METILIVLNFLTLAAVSAYAVRRMGQIEARAKTDLETMRSYYENKIKELQFEIDQTKKILRLSEHDFLESINEILRLQNLVRLFEQALIRSNVPVPEIPDYLKQPRLDPRQMQIRIQQGGIEMSGGQMDVGNDLTAGNKTQGGKE